MNMANIWEQRVLFELATTKLDERTKNIKHAKKKAEELRTLLKKADDKDAELSTRLSQLKGALDDIGAEIQLHQVLQSK